MTKQKILVTGGGGFVGRNLVQRLINDGHEVTITSTGSEPNLNVHKTLYMSLDGIDWSQVQNKDVVFHQMANNNTRCFDEKEMMRANFDGPVKLFMEALRGGCRKFVYASSTAVYGNAPAPYTEDTPIQPLIPYAKSKAEFDSFAKDLGNNKDISVIGLRYCNVYGPGESHKGKMMSMIGQIIRRILNNENVTLFKFGEQKRDWAYVKDVVEANILSMNSNLQGWEVFNIGGGGSWSFNEIFKLSKDIIEDRTGYSSSSITNFVDCPFPDQYQSHTECEMEKARRMLAFSPSYDLRSGIEDYVEELINAS